jgi:hypothetical protein
MNKQEMQLKFMDLIFFAKSMFSVTVSLERNGFMISNPQTHTHLRYVDTNENTIECELQQLKDFILMAHEYNEQNVEIKTHEELKAQGLDSAQFICSGGNPNKMLLSQSQRHEYLDFIHKLR